VNYPVGSVWLNPRNNAIVVVLDWSGDRWIPIKFLFLDPGDWHPVSHSEWYVNVFDECERIA
jgi:hypothetical protein